MATVVTAESNINSTRGRRMQHAFARTGRLVAKRLIHGTRQPLRLDLHQFAPTTINMSSRRAVTNRSRNTLLTQMRYFMISRGHRSPRTGLYATGNKARGSLTRMVAAASIHIRGRSSLFGTDNRIRRQLELGT